MSELLSDADVFGTSGPALLSDDDVFGSPGTSSKPAGKPVLLSDEDVFGPAETSFISKAGNVAAGIGERVGDMAGGLVRSVAGAAESAGDYLERKMPLGTIEIGKDGIKWRKQSEEEIAAPSNVTTLGNKAATALEATDFGYEAATSWEDVKASPLRNFIPFAIETGLISTPDMAAAVLALPAYIAARTGELGQERAGNDGTDNARVEDLIKVLPVAVASALLERLGAKGMFGLDDATGGVLKRGLKSGAKEAGTEAAQESVEYAGTTVGTEKGFDPAEMGDRALAGAVAGGTYGAAAGSVTAAGEKVFKSGDKVVLDSGAIGDIPADPRNGQAGTITASNVDKNGQTRHEVTFEDGGKALVTDELLKPAGAPSAVEPAKPPTITPEAREALVVPPPSVDRDRAASPRLTPEDRASPIPNDLIDDGKAVIETSVAPPPADQRTITENDVELRRNPLTTIPPTDRAMLRRAGASDDEIDVMSPEERAADIQSATDAGIASTAQDVADAARYALPAAATPQAATPEAVTAPVQEVAPVAPTVAPEPIAEPPSAPVPSEITAPETAPPQKPGAVRQPIPRRDMEEDVATTTTGREVRVRYAIVDADSLITSQRDEGGVNPDYPEELQPRDRERIMSQAQILDIARKPRVRELDKSPKAGDGTPIISNDGVVESGNGRVLGLRLGYAEGNATYRDYLAAQGYPVEGVAKPILVRFRQDDMAPADLQALTREANDPDKLAMSATEQAMADANAMSPELLAKFRGGDVDAAGNREFVLAFIKKAVNTNEQAKMITEDKVISQDAVRRIQGALLAKAYGDADLVASLMESTDTNIKAIGGALMDVSAEWAQMRSEAKAGTISKSVDQTARLLEAIRVVRRARDEGRTVAEFVTQTDIFSGEAMDRTATAFLRLMFRNRQSWTQPAGRERVADALRFYATEARKTTEGTDLLGETAPEPQQIIALAEGRQNGPEQKQSGLDLRPAAAAPAGEDVRPSGRDRAVEDKPDRPEKGRDEASGNRDQPAGEVAPARKGNSTPTASWVIRNKATGEVVMETFDRKKVDALNTDKYEAVPIQEHLASLSEKPAASLRRDDGTYRIREQTGDVATEFVLTKDFRDKAAQLTTKLRAALDKLGLNDVGLRVSEAINMIIGDQATAADGRYFRNMIDIALDAADPVATLNHESIHAMRKMGVFTTSEWSILSSKSKREWTAKYDIADRYDGFPEWAQVEEGVAHAYADWANKRGKTPSMVARIFERMKSFIEAFRNALRGQGFKSADSIFGKVAAGDVGSRPRAGAGNADASFAMRGDDMFATETVDTMDGPREQLVIPGAEKITDKQRAERLAEGRMKSSKGQRDTSALPLFGDAKDQLALFSLRNSDAFKKWFGDSKVVDENGDPLVMYHGTVSNVASFDPGKVASRFPNSRGFYFVSRPNRANAYADYGNISIDYNPASRMAKPVPEGANVMPVYLSIQNPKSIIQTRETSRGAVTPEGLVDSPEGVKLVEAARADGHDGVIVNRRFGDEYDEVFAIAFDPKQIKSAIGNRGTFDPNDDRIMFSIAERSGVTDAQGIPRAQAVTSAISNRIMQTIKKGKPDGETLGEYSHRRLVDYLHPVKRMIEKAGGAPQDTMDAYLQARLAEDASIARIQGLHDTYVTPMIEELARSGATLEELHRFAYAKHVEERNRVVGLRNEPDSDFYKAVTDPTIKGASGWSTNEAKQAIRELSADPKKLGGLTRANNHLRSLIDKGLLDQKKAGLISAETYDELTSQWQNYVPLRSEETDEGGLPRGKGFDIRGKEFKAATGRFTEAENVVAWGIAGTERAQLRAVNNDVGKAMLRFINHADPKGESLAKVYWSGDENLMDIEKAPTVYRREIGSDGKVVNRKVPPSTLSPDMFAVKVGGKSYYVEFADPKVGLALKKLGQAEVGAVLGLLRHVTTWQSIINTRANPAFVPINILRDAMTGGIHLLDEGFSAKQSAKILANIPKAWAALWRNVRGRPGNGRWDIALKEYAGAGGKITFENYRTIEDSIKLMKKQHDEMLNGKPAYKAAWDAFAGFWGDLNDAGENGMRLAAYVAAREQGRSVKQAAFLGRDLTVDFKKRGEIGPAMNSLFVFFNAAVQGNYNVAKRLATSKTVRRAAYAIVAQGVLIDLMNRALSGDDDDGESYYSKLLRNEAYKFERQMVLFYGSKEGEYFTIPLPYGYNALYFMGVQAGAVGHGDVDPGAAVMDTTRVALDAFNPLGSGGSMLNLFAPTILDPAVEVATNQNFFGTPIQPTGFPGDNSPNSQRYFSSTPDIFREVAAGVNSLTGGDSVLPGAIDQSPDVYQHVWDFVSGGIGRFFVQSGETAQKLVTGKGAELEPENIPFVRSFYGNMDDDNRRSEYYRQREEVQAVKAAHKDYMESDQSDEAKAYADEHRVQFNSIGTFDGAEKTLRKIRKAKRVIDRRDDLSRSEKTELIKPLEADEIAIMNKARLDYARNRQKALE